MAVYNIDMLGVKFENIFEKIDHQEARCVC